MIFLLQQNWIRVLLLTLLTLTEDSVAFSPSSSAASLSSTILHQKSLSILASSQSNEDLSGGIFFDGPSDFKSPLPSTTFTSSSESSQLSNSNSKLNRPAKSKSKRNKNNISKDVVIIGAGLAGLSIALHIALNSDRQVTIIEKEDPRQQMKKTAAASFAAAGMLAPHSERLPSGPLLDLCIESRNMYTDFVRDIEGIASKCGSDAFQYLWKKDLEDSNGLEPWEVGYAATGGFLAPAFAGDSVATWSPPPQVQATAKWLDDIQVHEMEPSLHPDVIGAWWFPEDASVDARRLTCALRAACAERGVQFMWGDGCAAGSLELGGGKCQGIRLDDGRILSANSVVVANGSWMRNLLPVPITPHKGQSFSLRMPKDTEPILSRILFAQDTYIVPKSDGRIVVGATVETGTFDSNVTPVGMIHCMSNAMQLVPSVGELTVEESWAGLRPTTPDKGPILGRTSWDNLFIAGGYWRNGVLLAPKTGQLIADLVINNGDVLGNEDDEALLTAFNWDRFTAQGRGKELAANTRYAASMHPVHRRASGVGIAAAVGTELGFYSGANAASEERKKDRDSLFREDIGETGTEEDAFERAAKLGLSDASTFSSFGESVEHRREKNVDVDVDVDESQHIMDVTEDVPSEESQVEMQPFEGSADALTVGFASSSEDSSEEGILSTEEETNNLDSNEQNESNTSSPSTYDETTYDGYTTIQAANSRDTRKMELDAMKKVRIANRIKSSQIDESLIGAFKMSDNDDNDDNDDDVISAAAATSSSSKTSSSENNNESDISDVYAEIRANKNASAAYGIKMSDSGPSNSEMNDPGFRIYHVNSETREVNEVPPYTSPGEFIESIENSKQNTNNTEEKVIEEKSIEPTAASGDEIFDGYQVIQEENGAATREEELAAMREARLKNRLKEKSTTDKTVEIGLPYGE